MRNLRLIIIIVLGVSLSSCLGYYKKVSHLSDEELEWVNCYNVGDTVLFQSDSYNVHTLVVRNKIIDNSHCPFYIGSFEYSNGDFFYAEAYYMFDVNGTGCNYDGFFCVKKLIDNDSIMFRSDLYNRISQQWDYDFIGGERIYYSKMPIKLQNVMYNGTVLSDCIVYDDTNSETHKMSVKAPDNPEDYIDSYIISKKYGLLSYTLKNGETFTRMMDRLGRD